LISIERLSKKFSPNLPFALHEIQAKIPKGEIIGLIGPDGAGKTTLIRLLTQLLLPTEGRIVTPPNYTIGYMPQRFGLYEDLTVLENLQLYGELRGINLEEKEATFAKLLEFSGLKSFQARLAKDLSGGMKQKLGLACALLKKPTLLLLDEPTVGVDPISRRELWDMMRKILDKELTIIWSTAYLDEAEKCDQILLLNEGKLLFFGKPKDFMKKEGSFEDAFISLLKKPDIKQIPLREVRQSVQYPIVAEGLTKKFGSFTATNDVSFQVSKGEIFGLLGPNGAGKSTTFKMLCGLIQPTSGKALINGISLQKTPSEARGHIGYMAQKFSLYGNLTVRQNLDFFGSLYCRSLQEKGKAIAQRIESFSLTPYLDQVCDLLPIGYKQRLSFATATLHNPSVLFLDEPTSGMDPMSRKIFWEQIQAFAKSGCTIMVTTHFLDEAEYCNRIALLYQSEMIYLGDHQTLKDEVKSEKLPHPTLDDAFIQFIERRR